MARETVREWLIMLGSYPAPHGDRVREAVEWFRANKAEPLPEDIRLADISCLAAIVSGSATLSPTAARQ